LASIRRELTDLACRTALRIAYPLAVIWWTFRGLDGTKIAVWANGRVLLVRHSYKPGWKLPGGGVKASEDHKAAAHRELLEEVGLAIDPTALRLVLTTRSLHGLIHLYEVRLDVEPVPTIDRREIVAATFQAPTVAAERDSAVQRYLRH
jgi:8-oxo-dGTP diphosphatase